MSYLIVGRAAVGVRMQPFRISNLITLYMLEDPLL